MARKPKRAARSQPAASDQGSIFDHFSRMGRPVPTDDAPKTPAHTEAYNPQTEIADLKRQIAELTGVIQGAQLPRAAPSPTQTAPRVTARDIKLDLSGLPDPVSDLEKFQSELQTRIGGVIEAQRSALTAEQEAAAEQQRTSAALMNRFAELFPDWAGDEEKVKFGAVAVIEAAAARGIDTQAYITTHADQFCKDVAAKLEKTFGPIEPDDEEYEDEEEDEAPAPRRAAPPQDESEDDGRTAGIFGGQEAGNRPARGTQERKGDLLSDLQDIQRKSGFF